MTDHRIRVFGEKLEQALAENDVYTLLDSFPDLEGGTPFTGWCGVVALALKSIFSDQAVLCAVVGQAQGQTRSIIHHLLVRMGRFYVDANGALTREEAENYWRNEEYVKGARIVELQSFDAILSAKQISLNARAAELLASYLIRRISVSDAEG